MASTAESSASTSDEKLSERFRDPTADITLRSSDGILFKFFRKNLEVHSGVFADAGAFETSSREIVDLTETSEILELFLQLMSHQEPPNLMTLDFDILASVAEAVEKYQVFSAMAICDICMRIALPKHPLEVLNYAARHNRVETMNAAAVESIGLKMSEVRKHLSQEVFVIWNQYFELWLNVLADAHVIELHHQDSYRTCDCKEWLTTIAIISSRLGARVDSLKDLPETFKLVTQKSTHVTASLNSWRNQVATKVASIPKFSTLLSL